MSYPRTEFVCGVYEKNLKVCWVSAGVSSFMAGYLAGNVDKWIYIDVADQHPDSIRFIKDCEKALGIDIEILRSTEYGCVEDCIRVFGGFRDAHSGFAPCTNWLKRGSENHGKPHIRITILHMYGDMISMRSPVQKI